MMKTADPSLSVNGARSVQASLDRPTCRRGLSQSDVRSVLVIIRQILTPKPSQMVFVQRDDVINQLAASTADPSFGDSVLPRAPHTRSDRFDATRL
jgi:hypothetical protein